jgi:membrane protein YdbS with pleckstrin-like domain
MLSRFRPLLLRWMRVPHDPEPPFGAPGSIKVFRAGANFYYVKLVAWIFAQLGAVMGILFSVGFISNLRNEFDAAQEAKAARERAAAFAAANPGANVTLPPAPSLAKDGRSKKNRAETKQAFVERTPPWVMDLITLAELLAILGFLAQLPVTFAAVRLDWELRWYIVTDRSLRIRAGLWSLQESTMSFANLQQVEVTQGPIQRLLGIADVRVQSAGGGSGPGQKHDTENQLHTGVFHGVDNAQEIRDLILDRLRHFRQAGLGDPDDHNSAPAAVEAAAAPAPADTLAAAHELLAEARALRASLQ